MATLENNVDVISYIAIFLGDFKKITLISTKKLYERCVCTLTNQYSLLNYSEKFANLISNLKCDLLITSRTNVNFKSLVKLSVTKLYIAHDYTFPESLRKIHVKFVACNGRKKYVTLPKNTRKFTLRENNCGYFPFILNSCLKILKVGETLESVPENVERFYSPGNTLVPGKKININLRNFESPSNFIASPHFSVVKLTISCSCPDTIEIPPTVRKFKLINYKAAKNIKFHEGIKTIKIHCDSLSNLHFPNSVKNLALFLRHLKSDVIAENAEFLALHISRYDGGLLNFPKNVKRLSFLYNSNQQLIPVFPENLESISSCSVFIKYIPISVNSFTLYRDEIPETLDLSRFYNMRIFHAAWDLDDVKFPPNLQKIIFDYSPIHIPDSVVDLTLHDESLPKNIPKHLKILRTGTKNIKNYLQKLKVDKRIIVYYEQNINEVMVTKTLYHG